MISTRGLSQLLVHLLANAVPACFHIARRSGRNLNLNCLFELIASGAHLISDGGSGGRERVRLAAPSCNFFVVIRCRFGAGRKVSLHLMSIQSSRKVHPPLTKGILQKQSPATILCSVSLSPQGGTSWNMFYLLA